MRPNKMNKMRPRFRLTQAQSTVEYLLLFAIVVAVIVIVAQGKLRQAVENMMDEVCNTIIESTNKIKEGF